jgi:MoaA/NifB/PqqE/SkfB family radical SAM enzyme
MTDYLSVTKTDRMPRLPLSGSIDLTYRCNNNCRHCWLRIPPAAPERQTELSLDEIRHIVDDARAMGCRHWSISGGEPMLRPDFAEIFDYITSKSASYSLNSNGTLITPEIAELLKRKGSKMIALYGATEEVHDRITRNPGSFKATMRGFEMLLEAGAGFTVQLIPMKDNYHEYPAMVELAKSLSPHWRVGAPWLYLSACGACEKNAEIAAQRLPPAEVIALDTPNLSYEEQHGTGDSCRPDTADDCLFARCILGRRDFHVDPYGGMTFCSFIKDPLMRYDLRTGSFEDAWERFIPSLVGKVRGGTEYRENCGSCEKRSDCRWCPVYAYLEAGRYSAKVPYLCAVADEARKFKDEWQKKHRRYFRIAGITVRVESDLDFDEVGFKKEFTSFTADGPGEDNVTIRHYFEMPDLNGKDLGREVYRKAPWAISRKGDTWIYQGISPSPDDPGLHRVAVFSADHTRATIYSPPRDGERIRTDGWHSLSLFPTDQIWIAPLLADRHAVLIHSAAAIVNGQGLLFVGHSEAGKSTTVTLLKRAAEESRSGSPLRVEILCDDRNIVQHRDGGWHVHGTWSHGDVPDVSAASAPLRAILFLRQDTKNVLSSLTDRNECFRRLLATLIRPMITAEWWEKELHVLEKIAGDVPCYTMHFDKSGAIVPQIERLVREDPGESIS